MRLYVYTLVRMGAYTHICERAPEKNNFLRESMEKYGKFFLGD
jgi:hypothetical protein